MQSKLTHYSSTNQPGTADINVLDQHNGNDGNQTADDALIANSMENTHEGDNDSLTGFKQMGESPSFGSEKKR